ncbi:excalibur calcium-binding domain-containing protein [Scytonema hofmannii]
MTFLAHVKSWQNKVYTLSQKESHAYTAARDRDRDGIACEKN